MAQQITRDDMTYQVQQAVDASAGSYDVAAIVDHFHENYGLVDIDELDGDVFWRVVFQFSTD